MKVQTHLAFLTVVLVALANLTPIFNFGIYSRVLYAALLVGALLCRARAVLPLAVLMLALSVYPWVVPRSWMGIPTLTFVIPLLVMMAALWPTRYRNEVKGWIRLGKGDFWTAVLVIVTGLASTGALVAWAIWTDQIGLGEQVVRGLAGVPVWILIAFGIPAFAGLNAVAEECVYRGVMQEALSQTVRSTPLVLVLQAGAFAAVHFKMGFPNGLVGYAMVFVYGGMLGYLRHRTRGLRWPILAHVLADLTIGYFLVFKFLL